MFEEVFTLASKVVLNFRNVEYLSVLRVSSIRGAVSFQGKQFHLGSQFAEKLCVMKF